MPTIRDRLNLQARQSAPRLRHHPMASLWLLLMLLTCSSVSHGAMRAVELQYRPASLLIPEIEAVATTTTVAASGNRLLLSGDADEIEQLVGLIEELDQPLTQYRISVRQSGSSQQQGSQWGVSGQLRTTLQPGARLHTTTGDRSSGSFTLHSSTTHRVTTTVGQFSNGSSRDSSQQVRALEGMPAYIETGREIPFLSHFAGPEGYSSQQQLEPVVTGFYVTPTPAWNNQVQLEITVRDERYRGDQRQAYPNQGYIESRGMSTSLRAPLGQWVDLGSSVQQQTEDGRTYTSRRTDNNDTSYRIELMVERSN